MLLFALECNYVTGSGGTPRTIEILGARTDRPAPAGAIVHGISGFGRFERSTRMTVLNIFLPSITVGIETGLGRDFVSSQAVDSFGGTLCRADVSRCDSDRLLGASVCRDLLLAVKGGSAESFGSLPTRTATISFDCGVEQRDQTTTGL